MCWKVSRNALAQIGETMLILSTTALAAGSLGSLAALWRDKTFQALAMTVLFLVMYLCVVQAERARHHMVHGTECQFTFDQWFRCQIQYWRDD